MSDEPRILNVSQSEADREARAFDFGNMVSKMPGQVARPRSVEELSELVQRAGRAGVEVAIRGGAHSQGGQTLTQGGLVIDTMYLKQVEPLEGGLVRAQGGARWGRVVDELQGLRQIPRVLVDTTEVTVGGTLSVGGLGTTSHRYGMQIEQVEALEVVIGTGEKILCSPTQNSDLFDAVRGGQGQFGIITDAWIRLRNPGPRIRLYELLYRDPSQFVKDFEQVLDEGRFTRLRAETRVHDHEIIMGAGFEYNEECRDEEVLAGLGFDEVASVRDTDEVFTAGMYPNWLFSKRMHHPWRDWLMPWDALSSVLEQPWLDHERVPRWPGSFVGVYPIRAEEGSDSLLVRPSGERLFSYSVLAIVADPEQAHALAASLKEMGETLLGLGGKAYLSGDVGYGPAQWKAHYGEKLEQGIRCKQAFDPGEIFRPRGMPFAPGSPD